MMYEGFEKDVYTRAVQVFGKQPQLMQVCEEAAELISALSSYSKITSAGCSEAEWMRGTYLYERNELIGERADVQIMLDQLEVIFEDKEEIQKDIEEIKVKYIGPETPGVDYMISSAAGVIKYISKYKRVLTYKTANAIEQQARVTITERDLRIARAHLQITLNSLNDKFNDGRQVGNTKTQKLLRLTEVMDHLESPLYQKTENTNESAN